MELSLRGLLSPVSVDSFFTDNHDIGHLFVERHDPGYYANLGITGNIEFLLSSAIAFSPGTVELIKAKDANQPAERSVGSEISKIFREYSTGVSVRSSGIQRQTPALWELCKSMEESFTAAASINMYLSPPNARALPKHFDRHDAFIMQIHGTKHWKLYSSPVELPLESLPDIQYESSAEGGRRRLDRDYMPIGHEVGDVQFEMTLKPGDLLFVPRGLVHEVTTSTDASIHLTIGIQTLTCMDLTLLALTRLAREDVRLRKSLPLRSMIGDKRPPDFQPLQQALSRLGDLTLIENALDELTDDFWKSRGSFGAGYLLREDTSASAIEPHTEIERRPGFVTYLKPAPDGVSLYFGDKKITVPREAQPELTAILNQDSFTVAELPGRVNIPSRLALVKRLITIGLLRIQKQTTSPAFGD